MRLFVDRTYKARTQPLPDIAPLADLMLVAWLVVRH